MERIFKKKWLVIIISAIVLLGIGGTYLGLNYTFISKDNLKELEIQKKELETSLKDYSVEEKDFQEKEASFQQQIASIEEELKQLQEELDKKNEEIQKKDDTLVQLEKTIEELESSSTVISNNNNDDAYIIPSGEELLGQITESYIDPYTMTAYYEHIYDPLDDEYNLYIFVTMTNNTDQFIEIKPYTLDLVLSNGDSYPTIDEADMREFEKIGEPMPIFGWLVGPFQTRNAAIIYKVEDANSYPTYLGWSGPEGIAEYYFTS